jgi:hypothetical protein
MTKIQEFIQLNAFPEERFLPINNFGTRFWISDFGRIISHDHRKNTIAFLKPHIDSVGYFSTQLRMKPLNMKVRVHQLVGEHFCEMVYREHIRMNWNHKDGIKINNHYTNLEYITAKENCIHAIANGLHNIKGEKHHHCKLTNEKALQIYNLKNSGMTKKDIGLMFGISRRQAADIINGKAWTHITTR